MPLLTRRTWLIVGTIVAIVFIAGFLVVRWALDPDLLKSMAESRLTAALGEKVTIRTVRLSFFPTVAVEGSDIVIGDASRAGSGSLGIRSVRLHPRLSSIFSRPIVIDRVEVDGVALNARRDAEGQWILPLPNSSGSAAPEADARATLEVAEVRLKDGRITITDERPIGRFASRTIAPLQNIAATVHRTDGVTRLNALTASVGRSKVAGSGSFGADGLRLALGWTDLRAGDLPLIFALFGTNAPPGLSIEGRNPLTLDLRVDANGRISASGRVAADRAALGTLALTSFASPVAFAANRLTLAPMAFHAYEGSGGGRMTVNAASSPVAWALAATVQRLDIDRFVSANTTAKGKVTGTAALDARLTGTSRSPVERTLGGTAAVSIVNGAIRDFPLLAAVYSALGLGAAGDRDLRFQSLSATFNIANERATTSDLVAKTGEMTMTAAGTIGFDQSLAMKGTVTFSQGRSAAFVHSIKELSALANGNGELEVPFAVSGTASAPRFSIDVADIMRRGLQNELKRRLGDRLRDLFKKK